MSLFELFQEEPGMFFAVVLVSLVVTIVVYGAFPVIFAKARSTPITKKKYLCLCFGVNFIGFVLFTILDGGASAAPYFLWTYVFSNYGKKILEANGFLSGVTQENKEQPKYDTTQNPLPQQEDTTLQSPPTAKSYQTTSITGSKVSIAFCRKCGHKLIDGALFCHKCGSKTIWNEKEL